MESIKVNKETDKNITTKDIIEITKGTLISGNESTVCKKFSKDTRTIEKGDIYIGIKGENFDGNLFWYKALDNGALGVIIQDIEFSKEDIKKYKDKVIIKVEDTLQALYEIASYKRDMYDIPVIAITGSVGKTSTKDIVANVVSQKYKTLKTKGNNNNNIGLPFTILNAENDIEAMVLEMGMNHFGEIHLLSEIAKPNICIITNIGTSHIGNLGSRENILKAKLEILDGTQNPYIIINNDNDLLHKWYEENKDKYNVKTYGIKNKSDIMAEDINLQEEYSEFRISYNYDLSKKREEMSERDNSNFNTGKSIYENRNESTEKITNKHIDESKNESTDKNINEEKIKIPVGGEHFILNSLCAISVGEKIGVKNEDIKNGIETFELTKNRMEVTELKNGIKIINDAYNSSVESVKATLEYMNTMKANRRIAVLGDVLETGEFAKELHEKIGEVVCKNNIDILICNGENSKYIIQRAKEQGMNKDNIYYLENREDIVDLIKQIVEPNDVILFKASNGMKFFEIAEKIKQII